MQPRYRPGMYGNNSSAYVPTQDIEGYRAGGLLGNGPRSMPGGVQQQMQTQMPQRPMVHQPPPNGQMPGGMPPMGGGYNGSGINPGAGRPDMYPMQAGQSPMQPPMVHQRPPQGMPYMPGTPSYGANISDMREMTYGNRMGQPSMPGNPNMQPGMQPNIGAPNRIGQFQDQRQMMPQQSPYQVMGGPSAGFGNPYNRY
jgi:hypothetical protein